MTPKLMRSILTNTIYAVTRYSDLGEGNFRVVGDNKYDVTADAIRMVLSHMRDCDQGDCPCKEVAA